MDAPSTRNIHSLIQAFKRLIGYSKYDKAQKKAFDEQLTKIPIDEEEVKKYFKEQIQKNNLGFSFEYLVSLADEITKNKDKKDKEEKKLIQTTNLLRIDSYVQNVEVFWEEQPFFYDKAGIFWFWNKKESMWEMVDEVDVMKCIDDQLGFGGQLVTSKLRSNYLNAFKHVGRGKIPENAPKTWVQFKDKIFDIETETIINAGPDYFICNPIAYEIGQSSETPIIDQLFIDWVGPKYKETLYEIIAYCCLCDYPIHLMFCLIGGGRNGKTQYQKIIHKFLGEKNICSTELDMLLGNKFESAKLFKKLVCTLGETNFEVMSKTSLLKKLTGGDLVGFEFKNKTPFDGYNYATIIINSNSLPTSMDTSDGFYRRWFILEFKNEFKEGKDIINQIPEIEYLNLSKKITEILPNILRNGLFSNQGSIEERKKSYIMASNPLPIFLQKFCEFRCDIFVNSSELFNAYTQYLIGIKKRKVSRKEFSEMLSEEGFFSHKTAKKINDNWINTYYIDGLALKSNWKDLLCETEGKCDYTVEKTALDFLDFFPLFSFSSLRIGNKVKKLEKNPKCPKHDKNVSHEKLEVVEELIGFKTLDTTHRKCIVCGENPCHYEDLQGKLYCINCAVTKSKQKR